MKKSIQNSWSKIKIRFAIDSEPYDSKLLNNIFITEISRAGKDLKSPSLDLKILNPKVSSSPGTWFFRVSELGVSTDSTVLYNSSPETLIFLESPDSGVEFEILLYYAKKQILALRARIRKKFKSTNSILQDLPNPGLNCNLPACSS